MWKGTEILGMISCFVGFRNDAVLWSMVVLKCALVKFKLNIALMTMISVVAVNYDVPVW